MGDRAILVSDEVKKLHERKEQKYAAPAVRLTPRKREKAASETQQQKRRRAGGVAINRNVKSVLTATDDYNSRIYRPKTAETEAKYSQLLAIISKYYPDESGVVPLPPSHM